MPEFISKEKYVNVQYDASFFKVMDKEIKSISENGTDLKNLQPLKDIRLTVITNECLQWNIQLQTNYNCSYSIAMERRTE